VEFLWSHSKNDSGLHRQRRKEQQRAYPAQGEPALGVSLPSAEASLARLRRTVALLQKTLVAAARRGPGAAAPAATGPAVVVPQAPLGCSCGAAVDEASAAAPELGGGWVLGSLDEGSCWTSGWPWSRRGGNYPLSPATAHSTSSQQTTEVEPGVRKAVHLTCMEITPSR
jgi:hypothetical protein